MLNKVILMGRITRDLELKQTPGGVSVLAFNIAVERGYAKQGEEREADFITCVAWRQQAEFISKYFSKGRMIAIEGNLRTRTYDDKNGSKHYVTEVYVDSVSFTGEPKQSGSSYENYQSNSSNNSYSQPPQNNSGNYQQQTPRQNNSGYQQATPQNQGNGYQQRTYNNSTYGNSGNQQPTEPQNSIPGFGSLSDYEAILDEEGVPF